jgi:hypothetical protein
VNKKIKIYFSVPRKLFERENVQLRWKKIKFQQKRTAADKKLQQAIARKKKSSGNSRKENQERS